MAALVWVMIGLAIWHFTIFLPDRCWAGIIGAFLGCVIGPLVFGFLIHGLSIPGQNDTSALNAVEAVPGTLLGLAVVYWIGVRQENAAATAH